MDTLPTSAGKAAISAPSAAGIAPAYDAFISYSQHGDKAVAQALRTVIQTIGKPWWRVRSLNVFLDATSLSAAPGLWQTIADRLDRSRYLILLASPEAAKSIWVDREVSHFIASNDAGIGHLLIGLTGGELAWDAAAGDFAWSETTPLPPSLRGRFPEEPLWVDLRPFRADASRARKSDQVFLHAALDLAATIKGVEKADLYSDEVKRQRRSIRIAYGIATVIAGLAVGSGIAAWAAVQNARRANEQAEIARQQTAVAEARRKEAVRNESVGLAALSTVALDQGDPPRDALQLVLAAWPRAGDPDRPQLKRSVESIATALAGYHEPTLVGHQGNVTTAAFSPDGTRVVTASEDGTARIWDAATGAPLLVLEGHDSTVMSAVFDATGKRVVTTSFDGTARIWDAATGKEVVPPLAHVDGDNVSSPRYGAISPDGTHVATAAHEDIWVWDLSAPGGATHRILSGHSKYVNTVAFSPDGTRILSASLDGTARVWDLQRGTLLLTLQLGDRVNTAAYSPDGKLIVTASSDDTATIWDAASGGKIRVITLPNTVQAAAFVAGGSQIVTASLAGVAQLWDAATGREIGNIRGPGVAPIFESVAASPVGDRIVTVSLHGPPRIWSAADWARARTFGSIERSYAEPAVRFSPDGAEVWATAGAVAAYDAASGTQTVGINSLKTAMTAVFSGNGRYFATGGYNEVTVWDVDAHGALSHLVGHKRALTFVDFSPDARRLVTASEDSTVRIWDAATGKTLEVLAGHTATVNMAGFSPDGTRIVTASDDGTARLWDAESGRQLFVLSGGQGPVRSAAFSPDGSRVLTRFGGKTVIIWDAATGRQIAVLKGHLGPVTAAVFSNDGHEVLTTSADRTARIWNATTGSQLVVARGHENVVRTGAFSEDGSRFVTASNDHSVRVWDSATGAQLAIMITPDFPVSAAAFSPDGAHIATVSDKGLVQLWDISRLENGDAFKVACQRLGKDTSLAEVRARYGLGEIAPICGDHAPATVDTAGLQ